MTMPLRRGRSGQPVRLGRASLLEWEEPEWKLSQYRSRHPANRHRIVNWGVSAASAAVVAACVVAEPCGLAVGAISLGTVFVAGVIAHAAVATKQERQRDGGRWLLTTGSAVGKGAACGRLFRRGCLGGATRGPKAGAPYHATIGIRSPLL